MAAVTAEGSWADGSGEWNLTRRGYVVLASIGLVAVIVVLLATVGVRVSVADQGAGMPRGAGQGSVGVVVEAGDSLWGIAEAVRPGEDPRTVVDRIRESNGLRSNVIQPGQVLAVPLGD